LDSLSCLALLLQSSTADGSDEVEMMLEQLVKGRTLTLGPRHPDTLTSVNDLALLRAAWDPEAAAILCQRALLGRGVVLGPAHPDTIQSFNDFQMMQKQLLQLRTATFGPNHPDTLSSADVLASLQRSQEFELRAVPERAGRTPRTT